MIKQLFVVGTALPAAHFRTHTASRPSVFANPHIDEISSADLQGSYPALPQTRDRLLGSDPLESPSQEVGFATAHSLGVATLGKLTEIILPCATRANPQTTGCAGGQLAT